MFFFSRETDNIFKRKLSTISSKARFFLPPNMNTNANWQMYQLLLKYNVHVCYGVLFSFRFA